MAKRIEQRTYLDDKMVDSYRPADLIGLADWLVTTTIGSRYERFTGQTYLIVVA